MRNVPSLRPIPTHTGINPWLPQCPSTFLQDSPAVVGRQETVQLVTQRATASWVRPRAVPTNSAVSAESNTKIGCSSEYPHQRAIRKLRWQYTQFINSYDFFTDWSNSRSPWLWRTHKKSRTNYFRKIASTDRI